MVLVTEIGFALLQTVDPVFTVENPDVRSVSRITFHRQPFSVLVDDGRCVSAGEPGRLVRTLRWPQTRTQAVFSDIDMCRVCWEPIGPVLFVSTVQPQRQLVQAPPLR
jgi:hypothetical protein